MRAIDVFTINVHKEAPGGLFEDGFKARGRRAVDCKPVSACSSAAANPELGEAVIQVGVRSRQNLKLTGRGEGWEG